MDLQTYTGRLCGEQLANRRNCLIYVISSVGCDTFGLMKDLHHVYLHETAYSRQKCFYNLSRAVVSSKDAPGTSTVQVPLEYEDNALYLIACVTQIGWGEAVEDNHRARDAVNSSSDGHNVAVMRADTKQYFKTCLKKLAILVMGHKDVENI